MTARAVAVASVLALCGCVSATECASKIPQDLRADAIRRAIDNHMVSAELLPKDDWFFALGAGRPWEELTPERRQAVAGYAAGYAICIKERVDR